MAVSPNPTVLDFYQRFQTLQLQRDNDDNLIKDLLIYCEAVESSLRGDNGRLVQELHDTQLDLEDAKRSRRDLQQQLNQVTHMIGQSTADCEQLKNRNPYIMVLVDGDGTVFNETLIRQGVEGGKTAANTLKASVLEHCGELINEIEIMAKVCANISGLSKALVRDGSLSDPENLRDFAIGFTQGKASFDFIDVGHGKERADSKIKECMRWHLRNHNCKQILLGISHDAGYAPFLDEVLSQDDRNRVTIIEGPPTVRELSNSGIQTIDFTSIFRPEKLTNRAVPTATQPSTWAGVTSIPPPPSSSPVHIKNGPRKSTPTPASARPAWNPGPRGFDPVIAVNAAVLDKVKRRTTSNKLCNNHYLRGPCAKGDDCVFEHDYKPSDEELKAIAYLTRLNPCTNGQDCEHESCIYGHHCPSVTVSGKEPVCTAYGCRFSSELHPPGTTIKQPRKEKWEYERY